MHTVPTWDHRNPTKFHTTSLTQFKRYSSVTVQNTKIESVERNKDGTFKATGGRKSWTGKKLLLTTGAKDVFPNIPGYTEYWISGI